MFKGVTRRFKTARTAWRTRNWILAVVLAGIIPIVDWSGLANWFSIGFTGESMSHFFILEHWPYFAIGLLLVLVISLFESLHRRTFAISNAELVRRREKWASEISAKIKFDSKSETWGKAIIINIERQSEYPRPLGKEENAWFPVDIDGLIANDCINVTIQHLGFVKVGDKLRLANLTENVDVRGRRLAELPLEWIEHISWGNDGNTDAPKIFCRFSGPRGIPFKKIWDVERVVIGPEKWAYRLLRTIPTREWLPNKRPIFKTLKWFMP